MPLHSHNPDYAVAPGETLKEIIEEREISQTDLAKRMGTTKKTIGQIINGSAPVSHEMALKLELALDVPARFWNTRESNYRETLLRIQENEELSTEVEWLKTIPVNELLGRSIVEACESTGQLVRNVLKFFGVSNVEAWNEVWLRPQVQFRGSKSHDNHPGYVAAWIRMGELASSRIDCDPYDSKTFREAVQKIRSFTTLPVAEAIQKAKELCARAGVAFVVIKEIPSASVSGVAKWLSKDKATIVLSLKYKTDDQFWFSFFHEAAHILLHGKKIVFVDDGMNEQSEEEKEANLFAREVLIPAIHNQKLPLLRSKKDISRFATTIGVSSGIVVGRLQHEGYLARSHCNDLKVKYEWA